MMTRAKMITVFISTCLIVGFSASMVIAGNSSSTKADPGNNATWSGKGGIDSGRENFAAWCITCHGEQGKGDGPLADSLGDGIEPRDLTDDVIISSRTDEQLFNVIRNGGASAGFSDAMMAHADMLTDEEIKNVVLYIRAEICKCKYSGN